METVIVDMDEVICDTMGGMMNWYDKEYGAGKVDTNKMKGSWVVGFPEEHQQMIYNKLLEPGFFRYLPLMKNSVEVLEEINKKYQLFIVSAAMEFPNSLKDKYDWLAQYFPFISWKQLVLCGSKQIIQGDYMIDDHARNFSHFGGRKLLYDAPHNQAEDAYERVHNWAEVAKLLL